jgi:hypothetical protein
MGYKIIINPPMVTNEPKWVTKLSSTHPWLQMNPTGYKIIDKLESKQASTRHNNKFKIMSHML